MSEVVTKIYVLAIPVLFNHKIYLNKLKLNLVLSNNNERNTANLMWYLTLYVPCIILQYVYEPTRCTKFLWLDFIFY